MNSWPHAPPHLLREEGIYMVTAGTYLKAHHFQTNERLQFLHDTLLSLSTEYGWMLHAWAVFSNHYHFIGKSAACAENLREWISRLHYLTAVEVNKQDNVTNRQVWFQYWDSRISIHTSYLARLNYIHQNPVKHGLVSQASQYPWCSAGRFEIQANRAFVQSVYRFNVDRVKVYDEF